MYLNRMHNPVNTVADTVPLTVASAYHFVVLIDKQW